ncbi:hypothetical protein [Rhizobium mesosinicum]|uniref:Uncharacterized protein n=1 Tax=Rhizobium mesosinicum TaxID=335017 RepID=A0ABS7GQU6_9HYPH|nr:hypothetical protein [Rhizobium mesosinicum]MBW9052313.1 hypothetical protein [Rhizobium mesosinicum]
MTNSEQAGRWLRWLIVDHLVLIVVLLMIATVFSILLLKPMIRGQPDLPLQRSTIDDRSRG